MAYQYFSNGLWLPRVVWYMNHYTGLANTATVDDGAEGLCASGRIYMPRLSGGDRASKTLAKIGFRVGSTLVKAGGSDLKVSLQGVSTSAGGPIQPDGVEAASVIVPNASLAASTYLEASFASPITVAHGDLISVVFSFSSRLGSDTFTLSGVNGLTAGGFAGGFVSKLLPGPAYAWTNIFSNVIFEFGDGTFGTLEGSLPVSDANYGALVSSPAEVAQKFIFPADVKIDGAWFWGYVSNAVRNFDVSIYSDTTLLASCHHEGNWGATASSCTYYQYPFPEVIAPANTPIYLSLVPDVDVRSGWLDVPTTAHLDLYNGHGLFTRASAGSGSWSSHNDKRTLLCGLRVAAIETGSAAAASLSRGRMVMG